jgi:hypothetical protein
MPLGAFARFRCATCPATGIGTGVTNAEQDHRLVRASLRFAKAPGPGGTTSGVTRVSPEATESSERDYPARKHYNPGGQT